MRNIIATAALAALLGGCVIEAPPQAAPVVQAAPPIPAERVEIVPAPPSAAVIWQPGEWHWNGTIYVWRPGHYVERVAAYHRWVRGHWNGVGAWIPGHWV